MEICSTMTSSSSPVVVLSDTESDDDAAALSRPAAERFTSSLCTQAEVDALCEKHGVPREFTARPAGDRSACTPPPPGTVCVYAHALEAGLRFPLHPFFSEALSHFRLAPSQVTPNGWRVLVGFFVLCHDAGVPPSLAVFRHFFSLLRRGWCCFQSKKGAGALFTGQTCPKSERMWKRGFFFLTSPEPWLCPVRWGEPPSKISAAGPVLSSQDKKSVKKLVDTHSAAVDLRTYLSDTNLAAAFSSNLAGAYSPPPPLQPSPRSTSSEGRHLTADKAATPAEKVKNEPAGDTPQLSGKKRKHDQVASASSGLRHSEQNAPPAAPPGFRAAPLFGCLAPGSRAPQGSDPNGRHSPVPETHDGDSADWEEARKALERFVTPARQSEFAEAKPSDVVASTFLAMLQELEEKQTAHEREIAALREQLEEAKAEMATGKQAAEAKLEKARDEVEAARRATETEVESAKTTAVQQFLESEEYTRGGAEQALAAYEHGAEDMKRVALRVNPSLDAARLVLPLD